MKTELEKKLARKMRMVHFEYYSAVVESGSCSMDGRNWEEKAHCGHKHRTIYAAEKCGRKLQNNKYENGSWSCCATWYNFTIHNQHGQRVRG